MAEARFRKLSNGHLIVPRRGQPPPAPEGYLQDPGDMYHYFPIEYTCNYRKTITINVRNCGCKAQRTVCLLDKEYVHPDKCKECTNETKSAKDEGSSDPNPIDCQ